MIYRTVRFANLVLAGNELGTWAAPRSSYRALTKAEAADKPWPRLYQTGSRPL
jgi:hypothetical protein